MICTVEGPRRFLSTAEWVIAELMKNPDAMARAQAEVRQAFKNKDPHDHESQMDELRYTWMATKETLRLHPPLPLLPRMCQETRDIGAFEVAKGTRVFFETKEGRHSPPNFIPLEAPTTWNQ
jgi:cytochrome P450